MQHFINNPVATSIANLQAISEGIIRGNQLSAFDLVLFATFQNATHPKEIDGDSRGVGDEYPACHGKNSKELLGLLLLAIISNLF